VGFEPGSEVEVARRRVVGLVTDLDACGAGLGEAVDARREDVPAEAAALVGVLGAHRLDETGRRGRIEPEQPVRDDVVPLVADEQVEVGAVQRRLPQSSLDVGPAPPDEVVRPRLGVEPGADAVAVGEPADRWPRVGRQPGLDDLVAFGAEAVAGQDVTHERVGAIGVDVDGVEARRAEVREAVIDDARDLLG